MNNEPQTGLTDEQMSERLHIMVGRSSRIIEAMSVCHHTLNIQAFNRYATECANGDILDDFQIKRLAALFASGIDDIQTGRAVLNM